MAEFQDFKGLDAIARKKVDDRARARTDKMFLATEVLGYDFQPDVHQELFDHYIAFEPDTPWVKQSDKKDLLVLWPRGHYKTTAAVVVCIQAILINPDVRILLMQGTVKVGKRLLQQIASHFTGLAQGSRLHDLFPEFCGDKAMMKLVTDSFTTPARKRGQLPQATCTVASPKSLKTGQHYDLGIFDDLVNDSNYRSKAMLAKVEEDFGMAYPLIDPGCYRIVSGTRYAFGDLYEEIMRKNSEGKGLGWEITLATCWLPDGNPRFPQRTSRDGRIIGFTKEGLLRIMADTPGIFSSQYLNRPVQEGTCLFDDLKLESAVISSEASPALGAAILFIDLASIGGDDNDDSVIVCGRSDTAGRMYAVDCTGGQWATDTFSMNIMQMALKHRPQRIMFEKTVASKIFVDYLRVAAGQRGLILPIDFLKSDVRKDAKELRIRSLESHMRQKRFFFFAGMENWEVIKKQFKMFPKGKHRHDDYPDTFSLMAVFFTENYAQNTVFIPLSGLKHPILRMMEEAGARDITKTVMEGQKPSDNSMGDDFAS